MIAEALPEYVNDNPDTSWNDLDIPAIRASLGITDSYSAVVNSRLKTDLDSVLATDDSLARDIALFGDSRPIDDVLSAYNIESYELAEKLNDPVFSSKVRLYRSIADKDPKAFTRLRAGILTDALLEQAFQIAMTAERDSDRLSAMRLLATLADAIPKDTKGNEAKASPNFVFNFGNSPFGSKLSEIASTGTTYDSEPIRAE